MRHKDDHPWLTPPEVSHVTVQKDVAQPQAHLEEGANHNQAVEEEFFAGPLGWVIALVVWFFPPILLLLIPIYLFKRLASKEDSGPSNQNPEANPLSDEDTVPIEENSDESQPPWWVIGEETQE